MKKIIFLLAMIASLASYAQNVAINTSGANADNSAMLDISSTTKGLLAPRMTTAQRTGINSPANGLLVFDTDTKSFWFFSNGWKEVAGAGNNFSIPYVGTGNTAASTFSMTNTAGSLISSAIYARNGNSGSGFLVPYSIGVWGDNSTGVGVAGTSNTIGVLGMTNGNDPNGIGVKGMNGSDLHAAVTGENSLAGGGVRGIFTGPSGSLGYGVIGETGKNGNIGVAGKFISNNPGDPTSTLWSLNYGSGPGLSVTMNNNQNTQPAIDISHTGSGKIMHSLGQNNSMFDISNNGSITTTGTVTVKNNKGIVRNSSATQLRMETPTATFGGGVTLNSLASTSVSVTFGTAFSATPTVYVANLITDGNATFFTTYIKNVTTTGCTLVIRNTTNGAIFLSTSSWKLVAIGAE